MTNEEMKIIYEKIHSFMFDCHAFLLSVTELDKKTKHLSEKPVSEGDIIALGKDFSSLEMKLRIVNLYFSEIKKSKEFTQVNDEVFTLLQDVYKYIETAEKQEIADKSPTE
jgi:hypothetical protein